MACGGGVIHALTIGPPPVLVDPNQGQEALAKDRVLEVLVRGLAAPGGQEVDGGPIAPGPPTEGPGGHGVPGNLTGNHAHPGVQERDQKVQEKDQKVQERDQKVQEKDLKVQERMEQRNHEIEWNTYLCNDVHAVF